MAKKKGRGGKGKHKPPGEEPAEPEEVDPDASDEEVAESDYVKPALPWEQEIVEWMGKRENRLEVVDTVRQRYLAKNNTTLMSEAEWLLTAEGFMRPYKPRAELMVQMLTTALCRSAVRRGHVSDNPNHISAALRWQKSEDAFECMATTFEGHLDKLDMSPSMNLFFHAYGLVKSINSVIPGVAQVIKHLTKPQLARKLIKMDLTMGNAAKSKFAMQRQEALERKTKARWNTLGSLFTAQGEDAEGDGLIASKVRGAAARSEVAKDGLLTGGPTIGMADAILLAQADARAEGGAPADDTSAEDASVRVLQAKRNEGNGADGKTEVKRKRSAIEMLLLPGEREGFTITEDDSNLKKVSKLALLEGEFNSNVTTSADELAMLWADADNNGNGDLSIVEWSAYVRDKFNPLNNAKANRKAFFEAAIDVDPEASKKGGLSMPILNRSNFKLYLNRCFEYNKVKYAFDHLDTSGDDRVDFEEYKARRGVFFKMLELDPKLCIRKLTIRDEFDLMVAREEIVEDGGQIKMTRAAELAAKGKESEPYINYHGMAHFYRMALDSNLYGSGTQLGPLDENEGTVDTTGTVIDIDEFQDMLLTCHYKTRTTASAGEGKNPAGSAAFP